jgi:hypothetical protein
MLLMCIRSIRMEINGCFVVVHVGVGGKSFDTHRHTRALMYT